MTEIWLLLISILLILICGAFVAAEFALLAVNRSTVEKLANGGDSNAKGIFRALKTLSTQLSGVQLGITLTSLTIGYLAEPAIATLIAPGLRSIGLAEAPAHSLAIVLGISLATAATMIYGELVPKYIALIKPLATARLLQAPMRTFTFVMLPLIRVLNGTANIVLRSRGVEPQEELSAARSADELLSLVRRSADKGTLTRPTALMLERSLNFRELTAIDIMTPRVRMKAISASSTIDHLQELSAQTGHSRFPVYRETLDNIVGIVRVKHALRVNEMDRTSTTVESIMVEPTFVPSTIELSSLLNVLKQDSRHIAIVVDEFGGVDGVVTIEDLLEELVGELYDEHDGIRTGQYKRITASTWHISGLLRPDEISHELGITLPEEENVETVAGLFMHEEEEVPKVGDTTTLEGVNRTGDPVYVRLVVLKMEGRRIDQLKMSVRKRPSTAKDDES